MLRFLIPFVLVFAACAFAKDDQAVFRSDVSLSRVDAQVLDRDGRAVTGLGVRDFVLRVNGKPLPIRNFASENMPIDVLLLLDVSGSMKPHVQRIASAAQQALNVLTEKDRIAIMVFDTSTHVRLPFRSDHDEVTNELDRLLRSERFNGGTHITRAMLDAANYMQNEARPGARRAIVILTDDQTQDQEDEERVEMALTRAKTMLSFLQAPYEPPTMMGGHRRGPWGSNGGGTWPGGGGGWPGGGGIGLPGGVGFPGGGGGYGGGDRSHTAGTANIAADSGGDTMQVEEASALEDTLARLRQRYTLYFYLPEGTKSVDLQSMQVGLAQEARIRYADAEVRSRRVYMSGGGGESAGPTVVTRAEAPATNTIADPTSSQDDTTPSHRKVAVNDDTTGPRVNTVDNGSSSGASQPPATPPSAQPPQRGGWPRANQQNSNPN
jgi:von Willebrand factor type A domain